ncbi:MAG: hypothetical protein ACR2FQ_12895, partial [Pseudonocardiaceae bacterium]
AHREAAVGDLTWPSVLPIPDYGVGDDVAIIAASSTRVWDSPGGHRQARRGPVGQDSCVGGNQQP